MENSDLNFLSESITWERPTLREAMAMAALPGCIGDHSRTHKDVAEQAYLYADAMIEAGNRDLKKARGE